MVSVARPEGETRSVRYALDNHCTNREALKTKLDLSHNINRRTDLIESKFGRWVFKYKLSNIVLSNALSRQGRFNLDSKMFTAAYNLTYYTRC